MILVELGFALSAQFRPVSSLQLALSAQCLVSVSQSPGTECPVPALRAGPAAPLFSASGAVCIMVVLLLPVLLLLRHHWCLACAGEDLVLAADLLLYSVQAVLHISIRLASPLLCNEISSSRRVCNLQSPFSSFRVCRRQ